MTIGCDEDLLRFYVLTKFQLNTTIDSQINSKWRSLYIALVCPGQRHFIFYVTHRYHCEREHHVTIRLSCLHTYDVK